MTIHQHIAAGIDLGSNTFRLLVADYSDGKLHVLVKEMAAVGLSRGLESNNMLQADAMQKGLAVLETFHEILTLYQPQTIRVCGTEALRRARNSRQFLSDAEKILLQRVDILSGEEEARLSLEGVLAGLGNQLADHLLLVDVGGGSTELVFAELPAGVIRTCSVDLGVVGLTERYFAASYPDVGRLDDQLAARLGATLARLLDVRKKRPLRIIGSGGTATSMAALAQNMSSYDASLVHNYELANTVIEKLWHRLAVLSQEKRNSLPCLGNGRGEILPAGIRIYLMLLRLMQQDRLLVSDTGLLEGILLSSLSISAAQEAVCFHI